MTFSGDVSMGYRPGLALCSATLGRDPGVGDPWAKGKGCSVLLCSQFSPQVAPLGTYVRQYRELKVWETHLFGQESR